MLPLHVGQGRFWVRPLREGSCVWRPDGRVRLASRRPSPHLLPRCWGGPAPRCAGRASSQCEILKKAPPNTAHAATGGPSGCGPLPQAFRGVPCRAGLHGPFSAPLHPFHGPSPDRGTRPPSPLTPSPPLPGEGRRAAASREMAVRVGVVLSVARWGSKPVCPPVCLEGCCPASHPKLSPWRV